MKKEEATQMSGPEMSNIDISVKKDSKLKKMFLLFAQGKRLHRFEAERHGDHCLNSTIPALQRDYGLYFERKTITVQTRFDRPARVSLYWLEGSNLIRARKIAGLDKVTA